MSGGDWKVLSRALRISVSISQSIACFLLVLKGCMDLPLSKYHLVQPMGYSYSLPSYRLAISVAFKSLDWSVIPSWQYLASYFPYIFYSAVSFSSEVWWLERTTWIWNSDTSPPFPRFRWAMYVDHSYYIMWPKRLARTKFSQEVRKTIKRDAEKYLGDTNLTS